MKFVVKLDLFSTTNPILMAISYIAVDPAFPYYFNAFTEVPINYRSTLVTHILFRPIFPHLPQV